MWQVKNSSAAIRRSKTAKDYRSPEYYESIEYCYQEWVTPTQWTVQMEPKGSEPTQVPYRNPKKEK